MMGRPDVFLNTASDVDLLPMVLAAADSFQDRPDDDAMQSLVDRRSLRPLFV